MGLDMNSMFVYRYRERLGTERIHAPEARG